jgi:DNA-binding transcriptional regulator YiaG
MAENRHRGSAGVVPNEPKSGEDYSAGVVPRLQRSSPPTPAEQSEPLSIAEALPRWRSRLDLSQQAAADALGIPVKTLRGWEGGKEPSVPGMVRKFMAHLEFDASAKPVTMPEAACPVAAPTRPSSHNVPQTLARATVEPFFRKKGKQSSCP